MKVILIFLFILTSCDSPLLNHEKEVLQDSIETESADKTVVFKNKKITADLHWLTPIRVGDCQFEMIFSEDITDEFDVVLWMPSMGHGSSPVEIKFINPRHAIINEVYFIMSGLWEVKLQLKNSSRVIDETILRYRL